MSLEFNLNISYYVSTIQVGGLLITYRRSLTLRPRKGRVLLSSPYRVLKPKQELFIGTYYGHMQRGCILHMPLP